MEQVQSAGRTDEELEAILHDTADWAIVGQAGQVLSFAASLHRAVGRTEDLAISGAIVTALSRLPFDNIIVDAGQISSLRKMLADRELTPTHPDVRCDTDRDLNGDYSS
jgi:hypothetical protein